MNLKDSVITIVLLLHLFLLQGCMQLAVDLLGLGAVAEGTGTATAIAETIDSAKTAGDVGSYINSGKSLTDHAISKYTGKDCRSLNVLEEKQICMEVAKDANE
jgi:hypothetical protein